VTLIQALHVYFIALPAKRDDTRIGELTHVIDSRGTRLVNDCSMDSKLFAVMFGPLSQMMQGKGGGSRY
jgi:hypothetical protein